MDAAAQAEAASAYEEIIPKRSRATVPGGWELPTGPSWDPEQRFGPRTPLVLARAAQLCSASADDWVNLADYVATAHVRAPTGYALSVSRTSAREPGRAAAVERLESAVEDLMAGFGTSWAVPPAAALRTSFGPGFDHLVEAITEAVVTHLVVESVADVLPIRVGRLGQGVVLAALAPPGVAPDGRWLCSQTVDRAVADLVTRTPLPDLIEVAAAWDRTFWDEPGAPILVTSWTSAGCSRPVFELLDPASCTIAASTLRSQGLGLGALQVWLTSLATVLTERAALDPTAVELFLEAGRRVVGLERLVNSPLTTEAA